MNVVMLSPGYPAEMAYFTRALAGAGARVIGVGDQPPHALPEAARSSLAHYEHVNLAEEGAVLEALRGLSRHVSLDQVERSEERRVGKECRSRWWLGHETR